MNENKGNDFFSKMEKISNDAVRTVIDATKQCVLVVVAEKKEDDRIAVAKLAHGDKILLVGALTEILLSKEMEDVVIPAMKIAIEKKAKQILVFDNNKN